MTDSTVPFRVTRFWLLLLLIVFLCGPARAQSQTTSATDGYTPKAIEPGSPAGSYALSGFDTINPYNGGLNFSLPLLKIAGRGGAGYTMQLPVETRWRVLYTHEEYEGQSWSVWDADYNWWRGIEPGYGPGVLLGRQTGKNLQFCSWYGDYLYSKTLTRLTFTAADGTEYELRDQATGGQPANVGLCPGSGYSRGTVFITADGSAATFTSDSSINDTNFPGDNVIFPSGNLMFRDGTRYRIDDGVVTEIRDRNGNKVTFTYDIYSRVSTIKDSLNREVTIQYDVTDGTYGLCDRITYKGFNNTARVIRVSKKYLQDVLRSGQTLKTMSQLWPELNNASPYTYHNPLLVSDIWLPDGQRKYSLLYNSYSELARVVLPTGGVYEYDSANGVTSGPASGVIEQNTAEAAIYRRVIEKRTYMGGNLENTMAISRPESTTTTSLGFVDVVQTGSGGAYSKTRHYYEGLPAYALSLGSNNPTSYPAWKEGREYKSETLHTDGTTVLRREEKNWQQRAAVSWWTLPADDAPANDPRVVETVSTLVDSNQVTKRSAINPSTGAVGFDQFNNPTDVWEYDYEVGAAGGLVRHTHTDYLTTNPINSVNYTAANVHIRSLPTQTSIFDAGGVERARISIEYDNYTTDASHALLTNRSNISGLDSAFTTGYTTRGNATGTTSYLLTNGTVTGSISNYAQFDIAGNVVKTIDGRGFNTTFAFADCFGAPDGNATLNSAPLELSSQGQASYALATSATNHLGHVTFMQFDYYLGRAVDVQDPNGIVSSGYFDDVLDRPTQIVAAVNDATVKSQTTFSYDDANRLVTSTNDLTTYDDNLLKTQSLYDNFGRTSETRQYEGGTNYIATKHEYDGLGRPYRISNPYRPWQSETPVWLTTTFDALGRTLTATTADSAAVTTSYLGNSVTATDQSGKSRKGVTDALGRLKEIYEDPAGKDYQTTYNYDVLDNLVKVTQGSQQRFFMYDSLKRLIRVRNPEQGTNASLNLTDPLTGNSAWSIGYEYDVSSNLTQKTDARGVVSIYAHDALNRNTTVDYSDTASINPDVKRFYDGATNGKGRFWYFYSGGDFSTGSNVDHTSIDSYDALGRPLVQRQLFKLNGVWSPTYQTSRGYNRAGGVISQTYPSVRTVAYSYDAAGRTSSFTGSLGDGVNRDYSTEMVYSPFGGMTKEKFDTATPLYNKSFYNSRGQLAEIRVGTTYSGPSDTGWQRGAIINHYSAQCWGMCGGSNSTSPMTDNNGNLKQQDYFVPDSSGGVAAVFVQVYTYDSLNRLQRVQEGSWQQEFVYDRWGNRTIDQTNTYGTGIPKPNFGVNTANNRLTAPSGYTMGYDAAGNLTTDTYTSFGTRTYDAENKMTSAQDSYAGWSYYTYNADGQRTRRKINNQETWQVYGFDGELLAEYAAHGGASTPQKEYGYRNGQLLINATPGAGLVGHWKVDENTGTSTADATGNAQTGTLTSGAGWTTGQSGSAVNLDGVNDYVQGGAQSKLVMTSAASFSAWIYPTGPGSDATHGGTILVKEGEYVIARYPNGTIRWGFANSNPGWAFIDTGYVAALNQWTHIAVTYDSGTIKTYANGSLVHTYSGSGAIGDAITGQNDFRIGGRQVISQHFQGRIDEVRVYSRTLTATEVSGLTGPASAVLAVNWLVTDHLGTPRMIVDQTGTLPNIKRHDYLPFGEELFAGSGGRSTAIGYTSADGIRQQFTQKERDVETGLDYFGARYYSPIHGRFTSNDPFNPVLNRQLSAGNQTAQQEFVSWILEPQHWNKYTYSLNNPLRYVDPNGEDPIDALVVLKQAVQRLGGFRALAKTLVSKGNVAAQATQLALDTLLGKSIVFSPKGLGSAEIELAKEVSAFEGRSFLGAGKAAPGIDGFLHDGQSPVNNPQPIQLQENSTGGDYRIFTDAGRHERAAADAGYQKLDLYVKSTDPDVTVSSLLNFIQQGKNAGLVGITNRGTIKSVTILARDGVVRIDQGKVSSCDSNGQCKAQ